MSHHPDNPPEWYWINGLYDAGIMGVEAFAQEARRGWMCIGANMGSKSPMLHQKMREESAKDSSLVFYSASFQEGI
jgi:N6-adenosine-specific RNA methylase IME4